MSLKLATLIYMSFSDRFFATKLPNGPDGHRSGEWWTEGNLFLNTKGNKFEHVPFKLFRERTGLSNVVPYDYRHLWCTWLGNHKVSFTESLFIVAHYLFIIMETFRRISQLRKFYFNKTRGL